MQVGFLKENFDDLKQVGCGTYGVVLSGVSKQNNKKYAIKLCRPKKEEEEFKGHFDIPYTSLREVVVLKMLNHPHIIHLQMLKFNSKHFALVFPFYPGTLEDIIKKYKKNGIPKDRSVIKKYIYQMLLGVDYMHRNRIIHRDLKPENVFLDDMDDIKIGDFGLSRVVTQPMRPYTNEVMTMLYRPPELVLGETSYGIGIDLWAIGCIIVEIYLGKPLFQNLSGELELLHRQFEIFGTPTKKEWPGMTKQKNYNVKLLKIKGLGLASVVPNMSKQGLDLVENLMRMNPDKRSPCLELIKHPFFKGLKKN